MQMFSSERGVVTKLQGDKSGSLSLMETPSPRSSCTLLGNLTFANLDLRKALDSRGNFVFLIFCIS